MKKKITERDENTSCFLSIARNPDLSYQNRTHKQCFRIFALVPNQKNEAKFDHMKNLVQEKLISLKVKSYKFEGYGNSEFVHLLLAL